ncbi:sigma factor-like helix-turn-helix DNA-binding protein [Tepidibacillus marianensis]
MHQLPKIYQRVIFYYYFDNLSYQEISKNWGL